MAQYRSVIQISIDELRKYYPNIQVPIENAEGIPCMVQDEQVTQYADAQGQQIITTVEPGAVQFAPNSQAGVYLLETIEGTSLDASQQSTLTSPHQDHQAQYIVQGNQIVTQQHVILHQVEGIGGEPYILQMDSKQPQNVHQSPQYVVIPQQSQNNAVQVDLNQQSTQVTQQNDKTDGKVPQQSYQSQQADSGKSNQQQQFIGMQANKNQLPQQQFAMHQQNHQQGDEVRHNQQVDQSKSPVAQHLDSNKQQYMQQMVMQQIDVNKRNQFSSQVDNSKQQNQFVLQDNSKPIQQILSQLEANKGQQIQPPFVVQSQQSQSRGNVQQKVDIQSPQFVVQQSDNKSGQQVRPMVHQQQLQSQIQQHQRQPQLQQQQILQHSQPKEDSKSPVQTVPNKPNPSGQSPQQTNVNAMKQSSHQQYIIKHEANQTFMQSIPVQVQSLTHQQLQNMEMSNVFLIQNHDRNLSLQNKRPEVMTMQKQKQQSLLNQRKGSTNDNQQRNLVQQQQVGQNKRQQDPQQHQFQQTNQVQERQQHLLQASPEQQHLTQTLPSQQQQRPQQIMRQQQQIQHSPQKMTQQGQHYNQTDGFVQLNTHQQNENIESQQQIHRLQQHSQTQQIVKQMNMQSPQQQQPRFGMISPQQVPPRMMQPRKKSPKSTESDLAVGNAAVFQKLNNTIVFRQQTPKRFPNPQQMIQLNRQESNENDNSNQADAATQSTKVVVCQQYIARQQAQQIQQSSQSQIQHSIQQQQMQQSQQQQSKQLMQPPVQQQLPKQQMQQQIEQSSQQQIQQSPQQMQPQLQQQMQQSPQSQIQQQHTQQSQQQVLNVAEQQQQKIQNIPGVVQTLGNRFPQQGVSVRGQKRITNVVDQSFPRMPDQMNRPRFQQGPINRPQTPVSKTVQQQTEPVVTFADGREMTVQQFERIVAQQQPQQSPNQGITQTPVSSRGRGRGRGGHCGRGGQTYSPRGRGGRIGTPPPRLPNAAGGEVVRKPKSSRGRGGRGGFVPCGQDVRPQTPNRNPVQTTQTSPEEISPTSAEEMHNYIIFSDNEKKILTIPVMNSPIPVNQFLQQAGISVGSTPIIATEQILETNSSGQFILKNCPSSNFKQQVVQEIIPTIQENNPPGLIQTIGMIPRNTVTNVQQQRFPARMIVRMAQTPSSPIGAKPRLQYPNTRLPRTASPRLPSPQQNVTQNPSLPSSPSQTQSSLSSPMQTQTQIQSQSLTPVQTKVQSQSDGTPTAVSGQPQPPREEARYVKGMVAICPFCGICSPNFVRCSRCHRKLPENVKSQSIVEMEKKKAEKSNSSSEGENKTDEKQSDNGSDKDKTVVSSGNEKRKPRACVKKRRVADEPTEILILSSDDEEEVKPKKLELQRPMPSVLSKEPVYFLTQSTSEEAPAEGESSKDLMQDVKPGFHTQLQCRSVRIGSYKTQPKEKVLVSSNGIKILVPSLKNESVPVLISMKEIMKALVNFGKDYPVIFLYVIPKAACRIRKQLSMDNPNGPYYDPTTKTVQSHKRITILLEIMNDENKMSLRNVFGKELLVELSDKEANEMLVLIAEKQNIILPRPVDNDAKIMVYPPPPEKGGITLHNQDYACLGEDQFLNDVIIDFYLKYLMLKVLSPEDRNRTHVFSTYFYKRLTTKPKTLNKNDPENDSKLSAAEKRHMRVKGWTKKVNLFEKDFIIVPINEHSHWFLAIICFPGLMGPVRFSDNTPVEKEKPKPKKNAKTVQIGNTTITHIVKTEGAPISIDMDSGSDRDEAEGDQDDLHPSSDDEESEQTEEEAAPPPVQIPLLAPVQAPPPQPKKVKKKVEKEPIKQPCILIFDSLAGANRIRVVATLRDYLKIEYKKKIGEDRDFGKDVIKGAIPKVPQQNNFTDCGLYVLQYVESFFKTPLHDFNLPLKYLQEWFSEEVVSCKRQELATLIRALMEEQGIKVDEVGLPALSFSNGNCAMPEDQHHMEEEEDEEEDEELNEEEEEELIHNRLEDFEDEDELEYGEEEEEEEEEEEMEEEEDEELERSDLHRNRIQRRQMRFSSNANINYEQIKSTGGLVRLKPRIHSRNFESEEDEEGHVLDSSDAERRLLSSEGDETEYVNESRHILLTGRQNVTVEDVPDYESHISYTAINRSNSEGEMILCEEFEGDDEDEEGPKMYQIVTIPNQKITLSKNQTPLIKKFQQTQKMSKGKEYPDIIRKLVSDKNITVSRREEEANSAVRKQIDNKKVHVKDCDKNDEGKQFSAICLPKPNNSNLPNKRPFTDLKSVRIHRKTDRTDLTNKRQKTDDR